MGSGIWSCGKLCPSVFMFYSSIMCQKHWAKNMEGQEFCSLIASQLYIWLMIHSLSQWKFAVNRWASTRATEVGPGQDTAYPRAECPVLTSRRFWISLLLMQEKSWISLLVSEHLSCWTVGIKSGIFPSFELWAKGRKWLSQWGGPCLQILSRRKCLLSVQSFAFKTWRKARFFKSLISYKEHPCTVCWPLWIPCSGSSLMLIFSEW